MSHHKMQAQRAELTKSISRSKSRVCRTFCCTNCRVSVSSTVEEGESSRSNHCKSISSLAHYLVQERLDQMIKQSEEEQARRLMEARKRKQKMVDSSRVSSSSSSKRLLFVVAMEKSTHDPRQDFRRSMVEVILANKLQEPKDLRKLLNYYISMNSVEYRGVILEAFYHVCNDVFFSCKCH